MGFVFVSLYYRILGFVEEPVEILEKIFRFSYTSILFLTLCFRPFIVKHVKFSVMKQILILTFVYA